MHFKVDYIYHIYNRGNNKTRIFFKNENYLFFLMKTQKELSDYFHFLAYCLMPNHFHFLVQVKKMGDSSDEYLSRQISNRIAILLRSYTRAINIQENRSGSLFQQKTKAKCLNDLNTSQSNYVPACFHYIHQNPINASLVKKMEDWSYSSFMDYAGLRNGTLCNQELAFEMIHFDKENFIEQAYTIINEKNLKGIWV